MRSTPAVVAVLLVGFCASPPAAAQPASKPAAPPGSGAPVAPAQPAPASTAKAASAAGAAPAGGAPAHRAPAPRGQPNPKPPTDQDEEDDPTAGTPRPAQPDERAGQLTVSAALGFAVPFGSLTTDLATTDAIAIGPAIGGAVGYGLSRYVSLEARGRYASYGAADRPSRIPTNPDAVIVCASCTGTGYELGLGLVYHAVQALAFDPWMSFGVGWRSTTITLMRGDLPGDPSDATFGGLDVARIGLGGDFFPLKSLGLGVGLDLALGTNVDRPAGQDGSLYAVFGLGLRVTLDPIGAVSSPPAPARPATGRAAPSRPANN